MIAWFAGQPLVFKIVLGGLGSLLLVFLLWRLWLRKYLEWQNVKSLEIKERVGLKIEFIKTAAQILGGLFFLVTIYVAWANLVVSQEKHKTDLFTRAIDQLGSEKLEVRLGGIYALERIAHDSSKEYWPIVEVLTTYVRERAPWPPRKLRAPYISDERDDRTTDLKLSTEFTTARRRIIEGLVEAHIDFSILDEYVLSIPRIPIDIQAILIVLGRLRPPSTDKEERWLLLMCTDLRGGYFVRMHLEGCELMGANLGWAIISLCNFKRVKFNNTNLEGALVNQTNFEGSSLDKANLTGAIFLDNVGIEKDQLMEAKNWILAFYRSPILNLLGLPIDHNKKVGTKDFRNYHLPMAKLSGSDLSSANLANANLEGADFSGTNLFGAILERTKLAKANLRNAIGLTKEQIASAIIDEKTKLPDYLKPAGPDKAEPK